MASLVTSETTALGTRSVRATGGFVPRRLSAARRDRSLTAVLVAGDAAAFTAAVLIAGAPAWAFLVVPLGLAVLTMRGLYRPRMVGIAESFTGVLTGAAVATGGLMLGAALAAPAALPAAP